MSTKNTGSITISTHDLETSQALGLSLEVLRGEDLGVVMEQVVLRGLQ
jgi:hypothetical protein